MKSDMPKGPYPNPSLLTFLPLSLPCFFGLLGTGPPLPLSFRPDALPVPSVDKKQAQRRTDNRQQQKHISCFGGHTEDVQNWFSQFQWFCLIKPILD